MKYLSYVLIGAYALLVLGISVVAIQAAAAGDDNPSYIQHGLENIKTALE